MGKVDLAVREGCVYYRHDKTKGSLKKGLRYGTLSNLAFILPRKRQSVDETQMSQKVSFFSSFDRAFNSEQFLGKNLSSILLRFRATGVRIFENWLKMTL